MTQTPEVEREDPSEIPFGDEPETAPDAADAPESGDADDDTADDDDDA